MNFIPLGRAWFASRQRRAACARRGAGVSHPGRMLTARGGASRALSRGALTSS